MSGRTRRLLRSAGAPLAPDLVGAAFEVADLAGRRLPYRNLDNAATTPALPEARDAVLAFLEGYGSVHRGAGEKSRLSTQAYERSLRDILAFVGAPAEEYVAVVTQNTTAAVNRLCRLLAVAQGDTVFASEFEHSANDLPWRRAGRVVRFRAGPAGDLEAGELDRALRRTPAAGRRIVSVTGASNITGALTPVEQVVRVARAHGALVFIDAAQMVAHRPVRMRWPGDDGGIDFLAFSGHKMYAPFGAGVLVARRSLLENAASDDWGGGNVRFVDEEGFDPALDLGARLTSGTPNAAGTVAMAAAAQVLAGRLGFERIVAHEQRLLDAAKEGFAGLAGVRLHGPMGFDAARKCAILAFSVAGTAPGLVAARLAHEFGIGVRHGAICQFTYVAKLLGFGPEEAAAARAAAAAGRVHESFGIVRASFGIGNSEEDVAALAAALEVVTKDKEGERRYERRADGAWWPNDKVAGEDSGRKG